MNLEKNLENNWQNFLKRDIYLIIEDKNKFFKEINQLVNFPRRTLFKLKARGIIRHFRKNLHKLIITKLPEILFKYNFNGSKNFLSVGKLLEKSSPSSTY